MTSRPPSSVGPNSLLSTPGIGRRKPHTNSNMAGDGWQTVGAMTPNKFQLKRVKKKYIEPGTSVICIHSKVRKRLLSSGKFSFKKRFYRIKYLLGCFFSWFIFEGMYVGIRSIFQEKRYIAFTEVAMHILLLICMHFEKKTDFFS